LVDGVFYSSIIFERDGIEEIIDARTSDAIALALRFSAPIFTYQIILDKAGVYLNNNPSDPIENIEETKDETQNLKENLKKIGSKINEFENKTIQELYKMLDEAVVNENYEKAALIRDEISKKES
jgi:bifunctional DNase/RNase